MAYFQCTSVRGVILTIQYIQADITGEWYWQYYRGGILDFSTVLIGYCDYHPVTNIGYCDFFPDSRFKMPFYYIRSIALWLCLIGLWLSFCFGKWEFSFVNKASQEASMVHPLLSPSCQTNRRHWNNETLYPGKSDFTIKSRQAFSLGCFWLLHYAIWAQYTNRAHILGTHTGQA